MKKITLFFALMVCLIPVFAQGQTITGTVFDETSSGMPGVQVLIKGTSTGTVTDIDGNYSIKTLTADDLLIFSYIGYVSQEIASMNKPKIDVFLQQNMQNLDQVIVVGYGVQKKSLVTGSISKLDSKDIVSSPVARMDQAIQGKTPGVYMAQSSGSPGSAMSIKIRGNSSNGKNDPLYIVNGVKTSSIDYLSPSDIESIEVLKDAASSAIYGSEGGNGVIIITTKKALKGSSEVNYNFHYGIQQVSNRVEMMGATEFINYQRESYLWEATILSTNPKYQQALDQYDAWDKSSTNTDWMSHLLTPAPVQEHNISFSSANEKNSMFMSGSYFSQDGIIGGKKNNFSRYTFNLNGESKLNDWLKVGTNISFTHSIKNNLNESSEFGGIISNAMFFDPTVPLYYNDVSDLPSNLQANPNDPTATAKFNALLKNEDGQYYHLSDYTIGETRNPIAQLENTHNTTTTEKLLAEIHADIQITKDLAFTSKFALDYSLGFFDIFTPKYYANEENANFNDTTSVTLRNSFGKQFKYAFENYATYNHSFGDFNLNAMAGMSFESYTPNYLDVTSFNVPHNSLQYAYLYNTLNQLQTSIPIINGGLGTIDVNDPAGTQIINNLRENQLSHFGRIGLNYKETYIFQGTIRRDASSLFPPDKPYGIFPSFSIGINLMKFKVIEESLPFVNALKVRFSWGQNGNKQVLRPFQYTSTMIASGIFYPDANGNIQAGAVPDNPGNPKLKWETSQQSDLGFDAVLLNNKVIFAFDYFDKRTKDQLALNSLVPASLGFNRPPFVNMGEVQNKGFEFDLSYRESESALKYSISANATYIKNEVLSYGTEGTFKDGIRIGINDAVTRYEAGYPVYYFRGYKALGIFQTQVEVDSYLNASGKPLQKSAIPGDVKFEDTNGDGRISGSDATNYLGKANPDWMFGFNLNLQYKIFDFSAFLQGVTGNQLFFAAIRTDRLTFNKPMYYYSERWTGPNTSNTYPRSSAKIGKKGASSDNFNWSNLNVTDGDYLRFKNLTIGITVPKHITAKAGINKLRFYYTGTNLFTLTKYMGSDPEIGQVVQSDPSTNGIDRGLYPSSRVHTFGVNVTF
jgi:TonB-linked SusC/RagA family outer membrane protein